MCSNGYFFDDRGARKLRSAIGIWFDCLTLISTEYSAIEDSKFKCYFGWLFVWHPDFGKRLDKNLA